VQHLESCSELHFQPIFFFFHSTGSVNCSNVGRASQDRQVYSKNLHEYMVLCEESVSRPKNTSKVMH